LNRIISEQKLRYQIRYLHSPKQRKCYFLSKFTAF